MGKKKQKMAGKTKVLLVCLVVAAVGAHFYIRNANAQQVKYTPTTAKDSNGDITECGFEFVASLPDGYGMQGVATFSPYSHLDFDVSAGKFRFDKLEKIEPKNVTLFVPNNILLDKNAPFSIYRDGQHLKNFKLKRMNVTFSLVQNMLMKGFKVSYIGKDSTKIEVDFPKDMKMLSNFLNNCRGPMLTRAQEKYREKNKGDMTCWEDPAKCEAAARRANVKRQKAQ